MVKGHGRIHNLGQYPLCSPYQHIANIVNVNHLIIALYLDFLEAHQSLFSAYFLPFRILRVHLRTIQQEYSLLLNQLK